MTSQDVIMDIHSCCWFKYYYICQKDKIMHTVKLKKESISYDVLLYGIFIEHFWLNATYFQDRLRSLANNFLSNTAVIQ